MLNFKDKYFVYFFLNIREAKTLSLGTYQLICVCNYIFNAINMNILHMDMIYYDTFSILSGYY